MIAYSANMGVPLFANPAILVTLCSALLMLPFILFSSLAGSLADKYEKSRLVVIAKGAEIFIMLAVAYGFSQHDIMLLMALLFVSGTHTTFYGPIKFSILPDHLHTKELLAGNGFIAAGSYIAILFGLIVGGLFAYSPNNLIGYLAVSVALTGFAASLLIPSTHSSHPDTPISFNLWAGTKEMVVYACQDKLVMRSIFALSWFMVFGSLYLSQFANYAEGVVRGNNEVYVLFLVVFSLGIALGSVLCDLALKGEISTRMNKMAAVGLSLFTFLMVLTTPTGVTGPLLDLSAFIAVPQHWIVLICMFMVAFSGGIYIVPLYAILQARTPSPYRSRVMAASNLSDSLMMTVSAVTSALLLSMGFSILDLFVVTAFVNLGVVFYARKIFA